MSRCTRSTPRFAADRAGFSSLELLISVAIISIAVAATSGLFLASKGFMREQSLQLETTHAARASIDMMLRELRLGGACLPVTGTFISLEGTNDGTLDEVITRTGLTRPDLSCVRTASANDAVAGDSNFTVDNIEGFQAGMRVYIRHPDGSGEYSRVLSLDIGNEIITLEDTLSKDFPATTGVYAIDERRFSIDADADPPLLELAIDDGEPWKLAVGIEALDVRYQLNRNCPSCDVVDLPADDDEWSIVEQMLLSVTAKSQKPGPDGTYYHRTMTVGVKPRNLLPRN